MKQGRLCEISSLVGLTSVAGVVPIQTFFKISKCRLHSKVIVVLMSRHVDSKAEVPIADYPPRHDVTTLEVH